MRIVLMDVPFNRLALVLIIVLTFTLGAEVDIISLIIKEVRLMILLAVV